MPHRPSVPIECRRKALWPQLMPGAALAFAIALGAFVSSGTRAQDSVAPVFELPVNCAVGRICHVQNYFDTDPGPDAADYTCGALTYNGHTGIDIRVPNLTWMARGVSVIAAAPGRVRGVRDGVKDVSIKIAGADSVRGRECGNGVVIDHGGGWESQYCHMMQGSIAVANGERVHACQPLGLIGLSGLTEFPHLHFQVRFQGKAIDPMVGPAPVPCGEPGATMFSEAAAQDLAYQATGLLNAGFAGVPPKGSEVLRGDHQAATLAADAGALIFWVEVFGATAGDRERFRIVGPGGAILLDAQKQGPDNHKASRLTFMEKRRTADAWPLGVYEGEFVLERKSDGAWRPIVEVRRTVEVR